MQFLLICFYFFFIRVEHIVFISSTHAIHTNFQCCCFCCSSNFICFMCDVRVRLLVQLMPWILCFSDSATYMTLVAFFTNLQSVQIIFFSEKWFWRFVSDENTSPNKMKRKQLEGSCGGVSFNIVQVRSSFGISGSRRCCGSHTFGFFLWNKT